MQRLGLRGEHVTITMNWCVVFPLFIFILLISSCNHRGQEKNAATGQGPQPASKPMTIGGEPVVTLRRPRSSDQNKLQFLEATVLPGRGMNLLQVRAYLPGKGDIDLLNSPPPSEAKKFLDSQDDAFGTNGFRIGAAVLLPWANRIRGKLSPDGKSIETSIGGKTLLLPADWAGKNPGAEKHAIHGLILAEKFQDVTQQNGLKESSVSGVLHAGNFGGHWPSQTDVNTHVVLADDALEMDVTATNVGQEILPMGVAFHPYFKFPSGNRSQGRLRLPSETRALVNNYDDVFPTGKLVSVKGTPFDFTATDGKPLGALYMDDNFPNLKYNPDGTATVEIIDPAANYGLRMTSLSPEVKAIQVYAPPDKDFIVVEPQFNWNDPFNKIWGGRETGMVMLKPGQSVSWRVRLEMFIPDVSPGH